MNLLGPIARAEKAERELAVAIDAIEAHRFLKRQGDRIHYTPPEIDDLLYARTLPDAEPDTATIRARLAERARDWR
jgi:hypothetical protein